MKQRIGIDARLYNQTGIGVYIQNLLTGLHKRNTEDKEYIIIVLEEDYEKVKNIVPDFKLIITTARWHSFQEQYELLILLNKLKIDLMHFTYFSYPIFYTKPYIATVHDVTPLQYKTGKASTHPSFIYNIKHQCFKYVLTKQVNNAKHIITPTKTIQEQIKKLFPQLSHTRISTTYYGIHGPLLRVPKNNKNIIGEVQSPYLLYVGNLYPHKNVQRLVDVVCSLKHRISLVLCTRDNSFSERLKNYICTKKNKQRIQFMHNTGDTELAYLYRHAEALVHPSLSEGLGLPIIEAMYFKTPIIASHIPVFKEILGTSYVSFDPYDTDNMRHKIHSFLSNPKEYDYEGAMKRFSFETMTEDTIQIYEKVLNETYDS